jgi:hypothetical protein
MEQESREIPGQPDLTTASGQGEPEKDHFQLRV